MNECRCSSRVPIQVGDEDPRCDNCGGSVPPWDGLPNPCRACLVCGAPISPRRRRDARSCSGACRADLSRRARLRDGKQVDGYATLADYQGRKRRES